MMVHLDPCRSCTVAGGGPNGLVSSWASRLGGPMRARLLHGSLINSFTTTGHGFLEPRCHGGTSDARTCVYVKYACSRLVEVFSMMSVTSHKRADKRRIVVIKIFCLAVRRSDVGERGSLKQRRVAPRRRGIGRTL